MSEQKETKIKNLLSSVPPGGLVDAAWLARPDVARPTVNGYVKRGWLKRLAHGVYLRPASTYDADQPLSWQAVMASMDATMNIQFHVGGMTALSLHGHGHYAQVSGAERVSLYADKLPGWLSRIKVNARFEERSLNLFSDPNLGVELLKNTGFSFGGDASFSLSSPERAVLEALDELPEGAGFDQLDMVFQGLASLSPRKLMALLQDCRKVKVVRLFFVFADRHGHAWLKHLDKSKLDFGKGDRQLVKGGKIHPTYRITVPAMFAAIGREGSDA